MWCFFLFTKKTRFEANFYRWKNQMYTEHKAFFLDCQQFGAIYLIRLYSYQKRNANSSIIRHMFTFKFRVALVRACNFNHFQLTRWTQIRKIAPFHIENDQMTGIIQTVSCFYLVVIRFCEVIPIKCALFLFVLDSY